MKILIVTDAWVPQTNGVVRTLQAIERELSHAGHDVRIVGPETQSWTRFALPFYREIVLELFPSRRLKRIVKSFQPDVVHIATEGPLGWDMRHLCLTQKRPFSTAYHTRFPEYCAACVPCFMRGIVEWMAYFVLRRFHGKASAVMVPTQTIYDTLNVHGFKNLVHWSRGVDTQKFQPFGKDFDLYKEFSRPFLLYVGRVSLEKNLKAFLSLQTTGTKIVIGSGPDEKRLKREFSDVRFLGQMDGDILARAYAAADLFVFPSKTDTFGLVLLEACAAGLRVAAYPVSGPKDVLAGAEAQAFSVLGEDLQAAVDQALALADTVILPRAFAEKHSWGGSAAEFYKNLG